MELEWKKKQVDSAACFPKEHLKQLKAERDRNVEELERLIDQRNKSLKEVWLFDTLIEDLEQRQDELTRKIQVLLPRKHHEGYITSEDIHRAKAVPISALVQTKPTGAGRLRALCPFHPDHSPSMVIYETNNTWHCFVCSEGGDVLDFVMKKQMLKFIDAVRVLINL